ncbi:WG repeat protein [Mobilisporobacter senegalensis]|uniref:WG repeat protein n=1 Tax=Mobilisporobacter senegalensis TaxID=1329262 RepID=A0A3N1XQX9_9FIRM|nr:WG repeat-containing protein [Mobilisporobacter senegalensis]ROR28678.1 WG repeat protein [Mobilisporobacter senegalensis]
MKGIKELTILGIVVLFGMSWYSLFNNSKAAQTEYDNYIKTARMKAEMEIVTDAEENYMKALNLHESIELRSEIAEFYRDSNQEYALEDWSEGMITKYPYEPEGYEFLAFYYKGEEQYYDCYTILNQAKKRRVSSKTLDSLDNELAYAYEIEWANYTDKTVFSSGYCAVASESGKWGYINTAGITAVPYGYRAGKPFTASGFAPVQSEKGEYFLINSQGDKKYVDVEKKNIQDCGPLSEDRMAVLIDGRYQYADIEFKKLFGDYDYAGTFLNGVAAVKENNRWSIIDKDGKQIGTDTYEDIKLDGRGYAFQNGVAFVKKNGAYSLIDTTGKPVGENTWEDAHVFGSDMTSVKKNGKWGYIDKTGEIVIEPQYENARTFSNELAAVSINGKWGYINTGNKVVIEPVFNEAEEFTTSGSAFIKDDIGWKLLKLYRLNKE